MAAPAMIYISAQVHPQHGHWPFRKEWQIRLDRTRLASGLQSSRTRPADAVK